MAASIVIQKKWRGSSTLVSFNKIKGATILLQSIARMILAIGQKNNLVFKLEAAGAYHVDDFFAYSKKRKGLAIKIQATYRKFIAITKYIAVLRARESSATKIQSIFRMYLTRKAFFVSKMITDIAVVTIQSQFRKCIIRRAFLSNFALFSQERRLASTKIQSMYRMYQAREAYITMKLWKDNPVSIEDCTRSFGYSKKRHFAASKIQAMFRKHLARSNYLELFSRRGTLSSDIDVSNQTYCIDVFFQNSKERQEAANKIQNVFRKHLFRTTCHFRMISFDDDSSVDTFQCQVTSPDLATTLGLSGLGQNIFCAENLLQIINAVVSETTDADGMSGWLLGY